MEAKSQCWVSSSVAVHLQTVDLRIAETARCRPRATRQGEVSARRRPGVYRNTRYTPWSGSLSHTPAVPILQRQIGPRPEEDTRMDG